MPLENDDKGTALVLAGLLHQSRVLAALSLALMLGAVVLVVPAPALAPLAVMSVALGLLQGWLALRAGLDARLFEALGRETLDIERMDRALVDLRLMPQTKAGRAFDARRKGAVGLMRWQGWCVSLQGALLLGMLLVPIIVPA